MFNHWKALKRKEEGKACQRLAVSLHGVRKLPRICSLHTALSVSRFQYPLLPLMPSSGNTSLSLGPYSSPLQIVILLHSHQILMGVKWYWHIRTAATKSLQSCPTLCDPMVCCPPGSSDHVILQARILEWAAISFSTTVSKIDNQQAPTIEHRELCSIFYNNPNGKIIWKNNRYMCIWNPMDRGMWQAIVLGVTKEWDTT